MSIKRYEPAGDVFMEPTRDGSFVSADAHDAEVERLTAERDGLATALQALYECTMTLYRRGMSTANYGDGQNRFADQDVRVLAARAALAALPKEDDR